MVASYPHGWSTASVVAKDWSSSSDHVVDQYRDIGISPTWKLTGRTQKWNYLGYDMHSNNGTNSLTTITSNNNFEITSLNFSLNNFFLYTQIPVITWFVMIKIKKKFIKL